MDVSVILVSYNTKNLTKDCLNSIFNNTKDLNFEVFVVDNNSKDGTCEMIENDFPQVHLIKNAENKGFGSANNIAIKNSNAKYVFCLNTDTLLIDNTIKYFFDFMEKDENQNIAVCGSQLLNADRTNQHSCGNFPSLFRIISTLIAFNILFPKLYYEKFLKIKNKNEFYPYKVDFVTGADLFIRKEILEKSGLFDEDFFMYYEDTELQHRINKLGYSSFIIPTINIVHYCGVPKKDIPLEKFKVMRQSELIYFEKCYGKSVRKFVKLLYLSRSILNIMISKRYIENIKMHLLLK